MRKNYSRLSLLVFLVLAACSNTVKLPDGNSLQPPSPDVDYDQMGIVILGDMFGQTSVAGTALFAKYDKPLPTSYTQNHMDRSTSSCTVFDSDDVPTSPIPTPNPQPDDDYKIQYLSAGDSITLKSDGLSYATLGKFTQDENVLYTNFALPKPLPDRLTIDIPGTTNGFPSFTNVPAGSLRNIELTSPKLPLSTYITPTTTFSWEKSTASPATIVIQVTDYDVTTAQSIVVICAGPDKGSFSFPDITKTEMGSNFKARSLSIIRVTGNLVAKDKTLLMIMTTRGIRANYSGF